MGEWQDIETAPKDGRPVRVRRTYEGRVIKEGVAVFGLLAADAPARRSIGPDPLGRLSIADYAREGAAREEWVNGLRWLNEDRMHAFPTPTEWRPA